MNAIVTIFNLIPAIIAAMKAIEEAIPQGGQGAAKLDALQGMLTAVDSTYTSLWPQIKGVVSVLTNLFNTAGVFKKAL